KYTSAYKKMQRRRSVDRWARSPPLIFPGLVANPLQERGDCLRGRLRRLPARRVTRVGDPNERGVGEVARKLLAALQFDRHVLLAVDYDRRRRDLVQAIVDVVAVEYRADHRVRTGHVDGEQLLAPDVRLRLVGVRLAE